MFKELERKLEELNEKRSWIRRELKEFFEKWEEATKDFDGIISSNTVIATNKDEFKLYLYTGKNKPAVKTRHNGWTYYKNGTSYFWDVASISEVRNCIAKLPQAIQEIREEIRKLEEKDNEAIETLNKLLREFKED